MLPFLVNLFPDKVLSPSVVDFFVKLTPSLLSDRISTPQWGLFYGMCTVMIPCGMKIGYIFGTLSPAAAIQGNAAPREVASKMKVTDKVFAKLQAMEEHHFENAVFFIGGSLAAIQAGVDASTITQLQIFWIGQRVMHMLSYGGAFGNFAKPLGAAKTIFYVLAGAASAKFVLGGCGKVDYVSGLPLIFGF